MFFVIEDGTGDGHRAKVTDQHMLKVDSLQFDKAVYQSSEFGYGFELCSEAIAFSTTASYSGILYMKNSDTIKKIHMDDIRVDSDQSFWYKIIRNPTAGTLISATTATAVNINFNSGVTASLTAKKGANDTTVTDGTVLYEGTGLAYKGATRDYDASLIMRPNDTIAVMVKPASSANMSCSFRFFFTDGEE